MPNYIDTNNINRADAQMAVWACLNDIITNWNTGNVDLLKGGVVEIGFTNENLGILSNSNVQFLLTIQEDFSNAIEYSLPGQNKKRHGQEFYIPYQTKLRISPLSSYIYNDFAGNDPKMKINFIFDELDKEMTRKIEKFTITPKSIVYKNTLQNNLSNKEIKIVKNHSYINDFRFIDQQSINNKQYVIGTNSYTVAFLQEN